VIALRPSAHPKLVTDKYFDFCLLFVSMPSKKKSPPPPFSQRLVAWRKAQKLSQVEAAKLFGLNVQTLQTWEQEIRRPMLETAAPVFERLLKDGF